jgi:hypothetical protein
MRRIVALAAAGLFGLCGTVFAATEVLRREETVRAGVTGSVRRVVVHAEGGEVLVRAGLAPGVLIEARTRWVVSRPAVAARREGDTVVVEAGCDALTSAMRCSVDAQVAVPPGVRLEVDSKTADVTLRGLTGIVRARTETGDVRAERLGPVVLDARSETGRMALGLIGRPTRVAATTGGGDLRVTVPYGTYRIDTDTDKGDVSVAGLLRDDLAPQRMELRTTTGDITVRAR